MVGEGMVHHSILLLVFIITMISAATIMQSIEGTNNGSRAAKAVCVVAPTYCSAGICIGGTCNSCPHDPLRCCLLSPGNCLSANGVYYGVCAPTCDCYGC